MYIPTNASPLAVLSVVNCMGVLFCVRLLEASCNIDIMYVNLERCNNITALVKKNCSHFLNKIMEHYNCLINVMLKTFFMSWFSLPFLKTLHQHLSYRIYYIFEHFCSLQDVVRNP